MRTTTANRILLAVAIAAILTTTVVGLVFLAPAMSNERVPAPRLVFSVAADKVAYQPGESVNISARMTNSGDGTAYLRFGSPCTAVYSVLSGDGTVVYDLLPHIRCGLEPTNLTVGPGDTMAFAFSWDQRSDSGTPVVSFRSYQIRVVLSSTNPFPGLSAETTIFVLRGVSEPNLAFTALTDEAVYDSGGSAKVTVILTNIGPETLVLHLPVPCFAQFVVLNGTGDAVYNSSKVWFCIALLTDVILAPGESRSWVFLWDLTTDAGEPLAAGQHYQVVPSFTWGIATLYQRYVSRTDVARFTIAGFTRSADV